MQYLILLKGAQIMATLPIRDPLNHQRMFDLAVDSAGEVVIVTKIGKIKATTPLREVIAAAKLLTPKLAE